MKQEEKMIVDTNLSVVNFIIMVKDLAVEYFDKDGDYQPHIGMLNAMRLFYNNCVKKSKFDDTVSHDIVDAIELEPLVADEDFIRAFNAALCEDEVYRLNFATALNEAVAIVENKRTSTNGLIDRLKTTVLRLTENMNGVLTDENIEKVAEIAKKLTRGDSSISMNDIKNVVESVKTF